MADGEAGVFYFLLGLGGRVAAAGGAGKVVQLARGVNREMERLSTAILAILPAVEDMEMWTYLNNAQVAWLRELVDAAYIADGLLERLALEAGEPRGGGRDDGGPQSGRSKHHPCIFLYCLAGSGSHCLDVSDLASEMKAIVKHFEMLARKGGALGLRVASGSDRRHDIGEYFNASVVRILRYDGMPSPMRYIIEQSQIFSDARIKMINITEQSGYWLKELNKATELRISKLNNVSSGEEAARARLIKRKHLVTLEFEWEWSCDWDGRPRRLDDEVLENLRPHPNLKRLIICNHCGSKLPSWMENQWLSKVETIELYCCLTWLFTPLGKLPFLKYLHIDGSRPDDGGSLESYVTQGWEGREGEDTEDYQLFPNLRILSVRNCFILERLPLLPPTLTDLFIDGTYLTSLPDLWGCDGGPQGENESSPTSSLTSVHISRCWLLTTLREGLLQYRLGALKNLTIKSCSGLGSFPDDGLRLLVSLKSLTIQRCDELKWSPENGSCLPSSLVDLKIILCRGLCVDSFFSGLKNLTSLSSLLIQGIDLFSGEENHLLLESLPRELLCHLTALTELEIINCPKLRNLGFQALASLRRLKISCCDILHPEPYFEGGGPPPLNYLEIESSRLHFLTRELLHNLTSLQELRINKSSLDQEVMKNVCSLTSLKKLYIDSCHILESLPDEMVSLTNLEELCITDCDLKSLPEKGLPASLLILAINNSNLSFTARCMEGRPDWPKFAHIPFVEIQRYRIETEAWKQLLEGA